jgi:putative aldouronate transport system permease protein
LALGGILNANFDQIFNLYHPLVYPTGDVLDTFLFRHGIENFQFATATALGLFRSIIGMGLILMSWFLADRFANYRIF